MRVDAQPVMEVKDYKMTADDFKSCLILKKMLQFTNKWWLHLYSQMNHPVYIA